MGRKIWTEEESLIFKENYSKYSNKDLQKLLPGRSILSLKSRAKDLKIKKDIVSSRIGSVEPLLLDTYEAYYWIGFIFADGSIIDNKRLSINISTTDEDHLKIAAKFFNNPEINHYTRKSDGRKFCSIRIQDTKLIPLFCDKFDLKKSKTYNPPIVNISNDDLFISFLAGFIDGDGSFRENKHRKDNVNLVIKLHSSWIAVLRYIENRTYESLNITKYKQKQLTKLTSSGYSYLCFSDGTLIRELKKKY